MMSPWPCFPTQGQQKGVLAQKLSVQDTICITAVPPQPSFMFIPVKAWRIRAGWSRVVKPRGKSEC